ncbi:MAG: YggS family pyridoxal phosphate-dependent enzyme [Actinomycetota bacterium]
MNLAANYRAVLESVASAAERVGRDPAGVTVVAVAKTFPVDVVAAALDVGIADIGENRAQELKEKAAVLGDRPRWHFVGHLQTNKVRNVVGIASLIHSVDRFGLGEAIARRATSLGIEQDILIEVNIGGEASKHGAEPARAPALAEELAGLEGIAVRGVMAIPPAATEPEATRVYFKELAGVRDRIASSLSSAQELSMGMTADFEVAVEEGATLVRVGEAIFGPRHTPVY